MAMDSPLYFGSLKNTPLGDLWVAVSENGLVALEWDQDKPAFDAYLTKRLKRPALPDSKRTALTLRQLDEYLRGKRKTFNLPIDWSLLRPFQRDVL